MINRPSLAALLLVLACAACLGQRLRQPPENGKGTQQIKRQPASFQGLTPGESTRTDVERVLGQSVDGIRRIMSEYKAPAGVKVVTVFCNDDNKDTNKVVYMIVYLLKPVTRSALIQKFNLPQQADLQETDRHGALKRIFWAGAGVI